jgi:hypothetical protein
MGAEGKARIFILAGEIHSFYCPPKQLVTCIFYVERNSFVALECLSVDCNKD